VAEVSVGDKVQWDNCGEVYVFYVNKIDGDGDHRWLMGSQSIGGENTMFVPMREVTLLESRKG